MREGKKKEEEEEERKKKETSYLEFGGSSQYRRT